MSRDGENIVWRAGAACVVTLFGIGVLAVSLHGIATANVADTHQALTTYPRSSSLPPRTGDVEVAIVMRDQSGLAAWNRQVGAARKAAGFDVVRNGVAGGHAAAVSQESARERQLRRLNSVAIDEVENSQDAIGRLVRRLGGRVIAARPAPNVVHAKLPAERVDGLRRSPLVQAVEFAGKREYLGVAEISGADIWHTAGCTGAGASDTCPSTSAPYAVTGPTDGTAGYGGPDVAVDDMRINDHHWAFTGGPTPTLGRSPAIVTPNCTPDSNGADPGLTNGSLHASTIASVIATKQPDRLGLAHGVDKILDPRPSCVSSEAWLLGLTWGGQPGLSDLPEAWNKSWSGDSHINHSMDDYYLDRDADMEASLYGIGQAIAAGNDGPYPPVTGGLRSYENPGTSGYQMRVAHPCVAPNAICVGAFKGGASPFPDRSDDSVEKFSSRGPSAGGRKKPDLVAYDGAGWGCPNAGYATYDSSYDTFESGTGWKGGSICGEGTSYAAPFVAGGQLLLSGVGVTSPMAQKAILINSAYPIDSEQDADSAGQEYWTPDVGWGELDLSSAYQQRGAWRLGATQGSPYNNAAFFRVNGQTAGDRTTLAWHRRAIINNPSTLSTLAYTTTDLDLYQLTLAGADNDKDVCGASTTCGVDLSENSDTGVKLVQPVPGPTGLVPVTGATGPSGIVTKWDASDTATDTVEQVRVNASGDSIVKVEASSAVDGAASEDFALASTQPLVPLATPTIDAPAPSLSDTQTPVGQSVTVQASFTNESTGTDLVQGLDLHSAQVAINLPAGVTLVSGDATQNVGTLTTGETDQGSWTVQATTSAAHQITFTAQGERFGTTFSSTATAATLTADSTAPSVQLTAPSDWQGQRTNPVSWDATDALTGVTNVEVEASIGGGPYQSLYNGPDAQGSVLVNAPEGASVTARVRATDGQANLSAHQSATWQVDGDPPSLEITVPPPVFYGHPTIVTVNAQNTGTPVTVDYRVGQDPATPFSPLLGQIVTVPEVKVQAFLEARATDGLGRSVSKTTMVESVPHPTRLTAKVKRSGARTRIEMQASPRSDGYVATRLKCRRATLRYNVIIRNGRGRMSLRRGLGQCALTGEFRPAHKHRYAKSRIKIPVRP